ncbi:MAG: UDP-N-acetylmuramoyl-L-alanine--D-glutamate ligase [Bacteroidota bacterium]
MSSSKNISILGGGESGIGAALLAQAQGANVFVSDYGQIGETQIAELEAAGIPYEQGGHTEARILNSDIIIKSPGIPDKAPIIQKIKALQNKDFRRLNQHAQAQQKSTESSSLGGAKEGLSSPLGGARGGSSPPELIGEIEYAFRQMKQGRIIAITGSNGKTTTTLLIQNILQIANLDSRAGGNLGTSFARLLLEPSTTDTIYVLEVSSFQLDSIVNFRPNQALLLNITPDHLDRYDYQLDNYIDSKLRIFLNQTQEDIAYYYDPDQNIATGLKRATVKALQKPIPDPTTSSAESSRPEDLNQEQETSPSITLSAESSRLGELNQEQETPPSTTPSAESSRPEDLNQEREIPLGETSSDELIARANLQEEERNLSKASSDELQHQPPTENQKTPHPRKSNPQRSPSSSKPSPPVGGTKGGAIHHADYAYSLATTNLRGHHNLINASFAIAVATDLGLSPEDIQRGLDTFQPAPHRMEVIGTHNEISWINDSKATNVDATRYALDAMDTPVIWIAGGTDKGNVYEPLKPLARQRVRALVCMGKDNGKLKAAFAEDIAEIVETSSAAEAVAAAYRLAQPGDTVLLSPACASFDLFRNYIDRGNQFRNEVLNLFKN